MFHVRLFLFVCILLLVSGCGPIYSTEYRYEPPSTARGRNCVEECDDDQDDCKQFAADEKEDCERLNEYEIEKCNDKILREKNRGPKWTECGRQRYCPDNTERCENNYRHCYEECGGTVKTEQVCVMNCPD